METKNERAEEALRVVDAIEEWINDNKERICFDEITNLLEGYRDFYGKDGDFFIGTDLETNSTEDEEVPEVNDDEILDDDEQLVSDDEVTEDDEIG